MTDAKELAARLRERSDWLDGVAEGGDDASIVAILSEAADAFEALAEENKRLRRVVETNVAGKPLEGEDLAWAEATVIQQQAAEIVHLAAHNAKLMEEPAKLLRTIVAQADRIAALEQAAAPFVDAINPRMIQTDFDQEERVSVTVTVSDLRALARAAGGGE